MVRNKCDGFMCKWSCLNGNDKLPLAKWRLATILRALLAGSYSIIRKQRRTMRTAMAELHIQRMCRASLPFPLVRVAEFRANMSYKMVIFSQFIPIILQLILNICIFFSPPPSLCVSHPSPQRNLSWPKSSHLFGVPSFSSKHTFHPKIYIRPSANINSISFETAITTFRAVVVQLQP